MSTPDTGRVTDDMAREFAEWVQHGDAECERCWQFDEVHDQNCPEHPDYDPTPWCDGCGARKASDCHCGPLAEND